MVIQNTQSRVKIKSKLYGDVVRSRVSDRITLNSRGGEVTWQPVEREITQGIKTVHPHLKGGGYVAYPD